MGLLRTRGSLLPGDGMLRQRCVSGTDRLLFPPYFNQMGVRISIESRFTMLVKGENGRSEENRVRWTTRVLETKLCFVLLTE